VLDVDAQCPESDEVACVIDTVTVQEWAEEFRKLWMFVEKHIGVGMV
jgi:hypothetical protein